MAHVTGVGGVFFRAADPAALARWYADTLGLAIEEAGHAVIRASGGETLVWSLFPADTEYFGSAEQAAMVNYRVDDLDGMLERLRQAGVPSTSASRSTSTAASAGRSTPRATGSSSGSPLPASERARPPTRRRDLTLPRAGGETQPAKRNTHSPELMSEARA